MQCAQIDQTHAKVFQQFCISIVLRVIHRLLLGYTTYKCCQEHFLLKRSVVLCTVYISKTLRNFAISYLLHYTQHYLESNSVWLHFYKEVTPFMVEYFLSLQFLGDIASIFHKVRTKSPSGSVSTHYVPPGRLSQYQIWCC